ncbi:MAG: type ISP restriction/modification enzyme [Thermoleophilia bacterium]
MAHVRSLVWLPSTPGRRRAQAFAASKRPARRSGPHSGEAALGRRRFEVAPRARTRLCIVRSSNPETGGVPCHADASVGKKGGRSGPSEGRQPRDCGTVDCSRRDLASVESNVQMVPMLLSPDAHKATLFDPESASRPRANVSAAAVAYLGGLDGSLEELFCTVVGLLNAPAYACENAGALRQDWPRVPLPATRDALLASAELGREVTALLDAEEPVDDVTTGSVRHELRPIGVLTSISGGQLDPSTGDLAVTAGWGHAGQGGVTMPGRGRLVERPYADAELAAFREGLSDLGLTYDQLTACLGGACYDVYLNDVAYWRCIPARVWKYTIGGYQVMKKWLSYRERALLRRDLKPDEARYVTEMTRRIAAILLLEPALDANYERVKADTYFWPGGEAHV